VLAWAGLDCGLHTTSICLVGERGQVLSEGAVSSEPSAVSSYLRSSGHTIETIGMEACGSSAWLRIALGEVGLPAVAIEAYHAHGVLRSRTNKTDRNDARGIAEMMRLGIFRAVHLKGPESRHMRLLLGLRSLLLRRQLDLEKGVRSALLGYGIKLPRGRRATLARRARVLLVRADQPYLAEITADIFEVCAALKLQIRSIEKQLHELALGDPVCRRFMTVPGVGYLTAVAYRAAVDDPRRFKRSRDVAAYFGLTPRSFNSGLKFGIGRLSKHGDSTLRKLLFLAALRLRQRNMKSSWLKTWGLRVARRRGAKVAVIAVARMIAVILHRMWMDGRDFRRRRALLVGRRIESVASARTGEPVDDSDQGSPPDVACRVGGSAVARLPRDNASVPVEPCLAGGPA